MDFSSSPRAGYTFKGHYETLRPLNHGSFGVVFLAKDRTSGKHVALKCLKKPVVGVDYDPYLKVDEQSEELGIHSRIGFHPNVVNLLDYFETRTHTYLVLEYCSMGDLYEAIRMAKGPRETEHVRDLMLQLVSAIEHLHLKGIYHRDIKPENIFLTSNGKVKLGDFGLATSDAWSDEIAVGSDRYMAPEQYDPNGNGLSPAKADIWSIGICLLNILFAKNPFAVPSLDDPLFADFVCDRQTLFDVFPTMSQDTFDILGHCLALDPEKRSLSALRNAIQRAVSFTTDDESLDEFCRDSRNTMLATDANREPLRTPSITSPTVDNGGNFPWAKALMASPAVAQPRQLSVIPDVDTRSEDLFPASEASTVDWTSSKAETRSIESVVDSGLGLSIGSTNTTYQDSAFARSKPVAIAGSLPLLGSRSGKTFSSIFGKKKIFESKSWSDMLDEDEEDDDDEDADDLNISRRPTPLPVTQLSQEDTDSDGHSTPRAILTEIKSSATLNAREINESVFFKGYKKPQVSQFTGFVFEDNHPLQSRTVTPSKPQPSKRSLMDKWAALGDRRRATTPTKEKDNPMAIPKTDPVKSRFRDGNWKKTVGLQRTNPVRENDVWQRKEWAMSTDWRRSEKDLTLKSSMSDLTKPPASQLDGAFESDASADESESEFIGRLEDLHT